MSRFSQSTMVAGRTLALGLLAFLLVLAGACGGADPLEPGRFEGNVFIHEGLGIRLPFPDNWVILPPESAEDLHRKGRELLSGGDPSGGSYASAGAPTSRILFQVNRYPLGTVQGINPSLGGAMEDISARPQIQTAVDYLQMLQSFLQQGGTPMVFEPIAPSTILGGQEFAILAVTMRPATDLIIGQVYYARRVDDGILTLVATTGSPEDWQILESILAGLEMTR